MGSCPVLLLERAQGQQLYLSAFMVKKIESSIFGCFSSLRKQITDQDARISQGSCWKILKGDRGGRKLNSHTILSFKVPHLTLLKKTSLEGAGE